MIPERSRRGFLLAVATTLASGCGSNTPSNSTPSATPTGTATATPSATPSETPTPVESTSSDRGPVGSAPIPDAPDQYTYATMGADDAPLTVDYYGNWKCPYCKRFSARGLVELVREYVRPGRIRVRFRTLTYKPDDDGELEVWFGPDAVRLGKVGLALWNREPDAYWPFHETVMEQQGDPSTEWATFDRIEDLAASAGVTDWSAIERDASDSRYETLLRRTARTAADAGIGLTPTLDINGQAVQPIGRDGFKRRTVFDTIDSEL
jgi:protein-disulfide isomerase